MRVRFWGVRGSVPVPGPRTVRYGGNTSCIEVVAGETRIILDAGTGLRELGLHLAIQKQPLALHLLLSHAHWDHIQGFPFFLPIYEKGNEIQVYGPHTHGRPLREIMEHQMDGSYFPVRSEEAGARIEYRDLTEEALSIGPVSVSTCFLHHPVNMLAYRLEYQGKTLVYTGDNEPVSSYFPSWPAGAGPGVMDSGPVARRPMDPTESVLARLKQRGDAGVVEFAQGADLLICDAQYTPEEYERKKGWGHSSHEHAFQLAQRAKVKRVAFFHHEPNYSDDELEAVEKRFKKKLKELKSSLELFLAREGQEVQI